MASVTVSAQTFQMNDAGYFNAGGTDVMAFSDFYPEGHQGGVCVIMNGRRIATNGDIRLEATPGQWQPVPKQLRTAAQLAGAARVLKGFNDELSRECLDIAREIYRNSNVTWCRAQHLSVPTSPNSSSFHSSGSRQNTCSAAAPHTTCS